MSNSTDQNQVITQYLLGNLPEIERERLDELSITSEEFAESLSTSENDLIDSYVQGELSGTMLAQFESHYLASPVRRERVEFAEAFRVFATRQSVSDKPADLGRKRKSGWLSTLSLFGGQYPAVRWGLAAALIVVLAAGAFLLVQTERMRRQVSIEQARREELQRELQLQKDLDQQRASNTAIEQELAQVHQERARLEEELKKSGQSHTTGTGVASFVLTPQMRGVGQAQSVSISANTSRVSMQLNLEPNDYQTFAVALIDQSNHQQLWRSGKLKASAKGDNRALHVSLPAGLLKPQGYALQVSSISARGDFEILSDYPFKVVKY